MNFEKTAGFNKDFKKLLKKYRSLEKDLRVFEKNVVFVDVQCNRKFAVLHKNEQLIIIKARFFCKYLKGKTMRIVYAQHEGKIVFIEIFYKGTKAREDKQRISIFLRDNKK